MQKTFLKFILFELVERISRFEQQLGDIAEKRQHSSQLLLQQLEGQIADIKNEVLGNKGFFNELFTDNGKLDTLNAEQFNSRVLDPYQRLSQLTPWLLRLNNADVMPEVHLFLADVLPGKQSEPLVFLKAETEAITGDNLPVDYLPVLQRSNPLAWVGLAQTHTDTLVQEASTVESLWMEHFNGHKKSDAAAKQELRERFDQLVRHAVQLRRLGPAYYFHAVTEAALSQDNAFFTWIEPALFYGLNHLNFVHKTLVILHEACERSHEFLGLTDEAGISNETLAALYRTVEKLVPSREAFQEKHFERAIQLQNRLAQGTLLSSSSLYPIEDVTEKLEEKRANGTFSIYDMLGMVTEYPQTPREIVNAGWLHKMERGPVWLYSAVHENTDDTQFGTLVDYYDHLLVKSIETSEVHRVLLCSA